MRALLILTSLFLAVPALALAQSVVTVTPTHVVQGAPVLVQVPSQNISDITSIKFNGSTLKPFVYNGVVSALAATTLDTPPGNYIVRVVLTSGTELTQTIVVDERPHVVKAFDIPKKLGGNTPAAAKAVVSTLASDNTKLLNLKTQSRALWSKPFAYPVADPVVTDPFGYQRSTVGYEIAHKGTDFRAPIGTPVLAMNRGIVRLTKTFGTYGKTIVIDHGLGLYTFYMHLSKINVAQGQLVGQGSVIGLSGDTGYAEGAHLHITVRINNTSVDPEKFLALFNL